MVFSLKKGVAPKNGPKLQKVGPNTKKTTLNPIRGIGGCIKKAIKTCHEIKIISALTRPNNSLKNAIKLGFFFLSSLTIWLYY